MGDTRPHRRLETQNKANCLDSGVKAGMFGGVALFAVIFYASGIPRIQVDILQVRSSEFIVGNARIC